MVWVAAAMMTIALSADLGGLVDSTQCMIIFTKTVPIFSSLLSFHSTTHRHSASTCFELHQAYLLGRKDVVYIAFVVLIVKFQAQVSRYVLGAHKVNDNDLIDAAYRHMLACGSTSIEGNFVVELYIAMQKNLSPYTDDKEYMHVAI